MKAWNELSMAEKADVMKLAIEGGVYDLDSIKSGYNEYAKGGKIHIAPSKRGTFTAAASRHGKSVQAFASQVLAHPENYSPAMRKKANFARNASHWKHGEGGNLFSGEGNHSQQIVTTGGAGYIPSLNIGDVKKTIKSSVRERAYNTISPYQDYSIMPKIKQFLSGKPRPDYKEEFVDTDEEGNTVHLTNEGYNQTKVGDELWAQYLQIPENKRRYDVRLKQSKYKPSQGGENKTYYKLPLSNNDIDGMLNQMSWLPFGTRKNMSSHVLGGYGLAEHTIGRGYDDKGDYISYFDKFDLNPFSDKWAGTVIPGLKDKEDASFGVGKPVNIYDRIYLDDYYGVKEPTHSMYLPEVTITGKRKKRKAFGGNLFAHGGEIGNYYDGWGDAWNYLKKGVQKAKQKVKDWRLDKSPAQHLQEIITPTADKKYRQNLYNIVDPTSDIPSSRDIAKYGLVALAAKYGGDYPYQRTKIDSVADAAWAKRLGLDYNQSALIDNGDGTVRLPSEIEAEIPTDTTALKNRIASNEKRLKQVYGGENTLTRAAINIDKQALEALRKTYRTGEPVMMDEHSHVSRNWQGLTPESDIVTPLNTLHRYTVQYDKDSNRMKYWDWYDFNEFENFVPGNPYKIQGSINLNKKK